MAGAGTRTSRRAILGAAAGGAAAVAAQALASTAALAGENSQVLVGGEYTNATSQTLIKASNTGSTFDVFKGESAGSGAGVAGKSQSGIGVKGEAVSSNSIGVSGTGFVGVEGSGNIGARFTGNGIGGAIQLNGRAFFNQSSGIATVQAGQDRVSVTPGFALFAGTGAFAQLQQFRSGTYVGAVTKNLTTGKLTIRLNRSVSSNTKVFWITFN
jgi:hypothetical protein